MIHVYYYSTFILPIWWNLFGDQTKHHLLFLKITWEEHWWKYLPSLLFSFQPDNRIHQEYSHLHSLGHKGSFTLSNSTNKYCMFHIIRMDHQLVSLIKRPQSMTQYVKASSESYDKTWSISYFPYPHRKITGHIREHCLKLIIIQSFGRRIYFSIFSSVTIWEKI